jgi:hypothetical protein
VRLWTDQDTYHDRCLPQLPAATLRRMPNREGIRQVMMEARGRDQKDQKWADEFDCRCGLRRFGVLLLVYLARRSEMSVLSTYGRVFWSEKLQLCLPSFCIPEWPRFALSSKWLFQMLLPPAVPSFGLFIPECVPSRKPYPVRLWCNKNEIHLVDDQGPAAF